MNLVVIEGTKHSFYSMGQHVISVNSPDMGREDIEFYRQNLDILVEEAMLSTLADVDPQLELEF